MASLPYQRHEVFQVSVMSAPLDGAYDGEMTIAELLTHGDFGLGTVDALDGELLVATVEVCVSAATSTWPCR